jgi:hypothetical protein
MKLETLIRRLGVRASLVAAKERRQSAPPVLKDAVRQPNGTFSFKAQLAKGSPFVVQASTDLENWSPVLNGIATGEMTSYTDSYASRHNYRFYRLQAGQEQCSNVLGYLSIPIPSGFSMRSSPVPQPGNLPEDLEFPIANGDVIHLFDRDKQQYVLYPYENGKWTAGTPMLGVGEAFWVAKTEPGDWTQNLRGSEEARNFSSN